MPPAIGLTQSAASAPETVQLPETGPGSGSLRVTALAVPGPALETVTSKTTFSPALIVWASGVLSTVRLGFWQLMLASSVSVGALVDFAVAVLSRVVQLSKSVGAVTVTVFDSPAARSPKSQSRVFPTIGLAQSPASGPETTQAPETPLGSGSLRVTPVAVPVPVLETVMLNTAFSPALIVPETAVLIAPSPGGRQLTWPSSESLGALAEEAVAVLS